MGTRDAYMLLRWIRAAARGGAGVWILGRACPLGKATARCPTYAPAYASSTTARSAAASTARIVCAHGLTHCRAVFRGASHLAAKSAPKNATRLAIVYLGMTTHAIAMMATKAMWTPRVASHHATSPSMCLRGGSATRSF